MGQNSFLRTKESTLSKSYLTCPHINVQQFTEYCLDCGYNIWTTKKEYLADLKQLERRLGIE